MCLPVEISLDTFVPSSYLIITIYPCVHVCSCLPGMGLMSDAHFISSRVRIIDTLTGFICYVQVHVPYVMLIRFIRWVCVLLTHVLHLGSKLF